MINVSHKVVTIAFKTVRPLYQPYFLHDIPYFQNILGVKLQQAETIVIHNVQRGVCCHTHTNLLRHTSSQFINGILYNLLHHYLTIFDQSFHRFKKSHQFYRTPSLPQIIYMLICADYIPVRLYASIIIKNQSTSAVQYLRIQWVLYEVIIFFN